MCTMTMTRTDSRTSQTPGERPLSRPREARRDDGLSAAQRRRVRRVRAALRTGEYENALKLHVTVDRLLDVLLKTP